MTANRWGSGAPNYPNGPWPPSDADRDETRQALQTIVTTARELIALEGKATANELYALLRMCDELGGEALDGE